MKYFDIETVVNSYKGFQDCMTNKSWGYLALLKGCKNSIHPSTPYEVELDIVSNFLENIFNLGEKKKEYNSGRSLYVVFSNKWDEYFEDQGKCTPNIFDVAVWAYRRQPFPNDTTKEDVLKIFAKEFNISLNIIERSFSTTSKEMVFSEELYSETTLKSELSREGVNVSKENIDAKKVGVVASPGEISRGPFIQTLYAGLEISDYVIIMQNDYRTLYGGRLSLPNTNVQLLSVEELVEKYVQLVTSEYSTAGNAIFMASYGDAVMSQNLKASDIYSKASELYPNNTQKFRPQELNHAYKMYNYFVLHPEMMHLPSIVPYPHMHSLDKMAYHKEIATSIFRPYITAIKSKPFLLLAGISGTGKSRIVRELARACWDEDSEEYKEHKPRNFEMVQVKPNWHDSSELMGYVSRIGADKDGNGVTFVAGDFLKFIARAWEEQDVPYFLCLDEMNLAPVEQYFAEYLSVVESRKATDEGVVTDPILRKSVEPWYFNLCAELTSDDDLRQQFLNNGICIPQNLIVIGTVNMDETTFSFSRKVLDRAMTIEMNEVDLEGGLTERYEAIGKLGTDELIGTCVEGVDVYSAHKGVCDKVIAYLKVVNEKLSGTPFKIAYRTRNEFMLYVVNNLPYNKDEEGKEINQDFIIARALDEITNMKILSRIEGDEAKVSKLFNNDELSNTIKTALADVCAEYDTEASISLAKLKEMKDKLDSGYTSFWS